MDGLLLVDKPIGLSSFDVVRRVRRLTDERKVGHTGTLDPLATGLLPIAIGRCTKLSQYLTHGAKTYDFALQLGAATDTGDAEGEVVQSCEWEHVTEEALRAALDQFTGDIEQVPPKYSAIKVDGQRAYELARKGEEVEMVARMVRVYELELLEFEAPYARLRTRCGAGTYVRALVRDLAAAVDSCAHATAIRRTAVAGFSIDEAQMLDLLTPENVAAAVLPPLEMVRDMPRYGADAAEVRAIGYGQRVEVLGSAIAGAGEGDAVAMVDPAGDLAAVVEVEAIDESGGERIARLRPRRVFQPQQ